MEVWPPQISEASIPLKPSKANMGNSRWMSLGNWNGEFEPKHIPKYQRNISGIEEKVISLYARGMSTRDIHDQLQGLYRVELSAEMVSKITDRVLPQVKEWLPSGDQIS